MQAFTVRLHNEKKSKRGPFHAAFIDLNKAFDRTWHNGLLYKLHHMGVTGRAWRWIRDFLSGRQFRVVNNGMASPWMPISVGVPQGAVLSPLLFLVFINDMPGHLGSDFTTLLYADDIALWPKDHTMGTLKKGLMMLTQWCDEWKTIVNCPKSGIMTFSAGGHTGALGTILIRNPRTGAVMHMPQVSTYKYLGLVLSNSLTWHAHTKHVLDKALVASRCIARIVIGGTNAAANRSATVATIRALVNACLLPIISYAMPLWQPPKTHGLQRKLNSCITRPLLRALALPYNAEHEAVRCYTAVMGVNSLLHHAALRTAFRLEQLEPSHPAAKQWHNEQWSHLSLLTGEAPDTPIVPPQSVLCQTVAPALKCLVGGTVAITRDLIGKDLMGDSGELIRPCVLKHAMTHWYRNAERSRLLKSTINVHIVQNGNEPNPTLTIDSPAIARVRARFRFDRSALGDARQRHGYAKNKPRAVPKPCPLCGAPKDDFEHFLHSCTAPVMMSARQRALRFLHHPIIARGDTVDLPIDAIVAYTDGSFKRYKSAPAASGAAALLAYPYDPHAHLADANEQPINEAPGDTDCYVNFNPAHAISNLQRYYPRTHIGDPLSGIPEGGRWWSTRCRSIPHGTNNIGELAAIALALQDIDQVAATARAVHGHGNVFDTVPIAIITDSQYAQHVLTGHTSPRKHKKLVRGIRWALQQLTHHGRRAISIHWTKGHAHSAGNNYVDRLAGAARMAAHQAHRHCSIDGNGHCTETAPDWSHLIPSTTPAPPPQSPPTMCTAKSFILSGDATELGYNSDEIGQHAAKAMTKGTGLYLSALAHARESVTNMI